MSREPTSISTIYVGSLPKFMVERDCLKGSGTIKKLTFSIRLSNNFFLNLYSKCLNLVLCSLSR